MTITVGPRPPLTFTAVVDIAVSLRVSMVYIANGAKEEDVIIRAPTLVGTFGSIRRLSSIMIGLSTRLHSDSDQTLCFLFYSEDLRWLPVWI